MRTRHPAVAVTALLLPLTACTTSSPSDGRPVGVVTSLGPAPGAGAANTLAAVPPVPAAPPIQSPVREREGNNDHGNATIAQGLPEAAARAAGMGSDGHPVITVVGGDTYCLTDATTVPRGLTWFRLWNTSAKLNELYVATADGTELAEVENVATNSGGAMLFATSPGTLKLLCEPGMNDLQYEASVKVV